MKRDMDLVREILLALEAQEEAFSPQRLEIDGYSAEQIGYHCYIMDEAGLLEAADTTTFDSKSPEALATH